MVIHTLAFPDNCKFQKVVESGIGELELVLRRWFIASGTTKLFHEPTVASGTNPYRNQPRFDAESSSSSPVSSFGKYLNGRVIAFFFSPSFIYSRRIKIEWPLNGSKFQEWKTSFWLKNRACDDISKKKFAPFLTFVISLLSIFY